MKALVTGAVGFVGRHMVKALTARGWDVLGVDTRVSSACGHGVVRMDARSVFTGVSLNDMHFDLVVHCAYHVGGRAEIDGNPSLLALNVELDAQLFNWAVRTDQGAVMYFSSSAAYPIAYQKAGSRVWLAENTIDLHNVAQPDSRYGWAKLTGEQLAAAAAAEGLRVHILRPFSGYGGDQDQVYPFPAVVSRVLAGDLSVWGPPGQIRDWIHISDVINGALAVYDDDYREPVNLCTGVGTEFGQLAVYIARAACMQADPTEIQYQRDKPTGVMVRVGDPTRLRNIYESKITLGEGIRIALAGIDQ